MSKRDQFKKKIARKKSRILTIDDLKDIGRDIMGEDYTDSKLYKLIYHTKTQGYLTAIKKDLFIPVSPDQPLEEQQIIERHYRPLLKRHCTQTYGPRRYVGGLKALELITGTYSAPDTIEIVTPDSQGSSILLLDKKLYIKSYSHDGESLFGTLYSQTEKIKIGTTALRRAGLELALLESLYSPDIVTLGYTTELAKRTLKKYKKHLNEDNIIALVRMNKHHSSLNRLYHIALGIDTKLATRLENLIKKHSFFVDV